MATVSRGSASPASIDRVDRLGPDGLRDLAQLLRDVIAADGHRGVGANALEFLAEPGQATGILATAGGRLDGFGFCRAHADDRTWDVEVTVHPERRRNGLGGALLAAAIDAVPVGAVPRVWAYRPGEAQRRLAARRRLTPALHLLHLRGGTSVPPGPPPPGVRLRGFEPGDAERVLAAHNAAFATERLTGPELRIRLARPHMSREHLVLAEAGGGALAGYCWMAGPRPDGEGEGHGELVLLAVHPDHHGKGLGRVLTSAGLALLARRGVDRCMLYTDAANHAAVRLYRRLGFTPHHTDAALTSDGTLPWPPAGGDRWGEPAVGGDGGAA